MKKIYDRRILVKIDGWEKFEDTSIFRHLEYKDKAYEQQDFSYRFETFKEAQEQIETGWVRNAGVSKTFFTKRPMLIISTENLDHTIRMTEKNYKPIEVRVIYEEYKAPITEIASLLTAEDFCEYLKDRGISSVKF